MLESCTGAKVRRVSQLFENDIKVLKLTTASSSSSSDYSRSPSPACTAPPSVPRALPPREDSFTRHTSLLTPKHLLTTNNDINHHTTHQNPSNTTPPSTGPFPHSLRIPLRRQNPPKACSPPSLQHTAPIHQLTYPPPTHPLSRRRKSTQTKAETSAPKCKREEDAGRI